MPFIMDDTPRHFCSSLSTIGALKYGEFTLTSGRSTSYFIDLRLVMSHPDLMDNLSRAIVDTISRLKLDFDCICGVPYAALPLATLISVNLNKPMVLRRKEPKNYGTSTLVEGKYKPGDSCIIIDDVIADGISIQETISDIESVGMTVRNIIVVVDREEGGIQKLKARGYNIQSLYTISQITDVLGEENQIDREFLNRLETEKQILRITNESSVTNHVDDSSWLFEKRMERTKSMAARKLFSLMSKKQTNLCVAADVPDIKKLLTLANDVGPYICMLKVRLISLEIYTEKQIDELKSIATHHQFLIMEDRKLSDTGNAVRLQFNRISKWASLITAHSVPGFGLLEAIKTSDRYSPDIGIFLIAELKNENNLISPDYTKKTVALAKNYPEIVAGVISHSEIPLDKNMIQIRSTDSVTSSGSNILDSISDLNGDIIMVGKPITNGSKIPAEVAKEFSQHLWRKYLHEVGQRV